VKWLDITINIHALTVSIIMRINIVEVVKGFIINVKKLEIAAVNPQISG